MKSNAPKVGRTWARSSRVGGVAAVFWLLYGAGAASAQALPQTCSSGVEPRGTLGITGFFCNCSYETGEAGASRSWSFDTEPEITSLAASGPADGVLQEGDIVVAIDGRLITTSAGGRRWSLIRPREEVQLRVRRGAELLQVPMRAGAYCPGESVRSRPSDRSSDPLPGIRVLPRGWLGIGLMCDCSVDAGQEVPRWTFHQPPEISHVVSESPAAEAGLRPGDILLRIDDQLLATPAGGRAFSQIRPDSRVRITLRRDGRLHTVEVVPGSGKDAEGRSGGNS